MLYFIYSYKLISYYKLISTTTSAMASIYALVSETVCNLETIIELYIKKIKYKNKKCTR